MVGTPCNKSLLPCSFFSKPFVTKTGQSIRRDIKDIAQLIFIGALVVSHRLIIDERINIT